MAQRLIYALTWLLLQCAIVTSTMSACSQFTCNDGSCINSEWRCDGTVDCLDVSDEQSCNAICENNELQCRNGMCLPKYFACDGNDDCLDGSDEINCTVCGERLTAGTGFVTTPGFSRSTTYSSNLKCSWLIDVGPMYNQIVLTTVYFRLESGDSYSCRHVDHVTVWNEVTGSSVAGPLCGSYSSGAQIIIPSSRALINFTSDGSIEAAGFNISYKAILSGDSSCGTLCTFDNDSCIWSNDHGDFNWTRNSDSTPSSSTGPSSDHTTGYGHYMYIETSSPRLSGDKARISSGYYTPSMANCLCFYFHMYGSTMGTLNVYQNQQIIWTKSYDQGNYWHFARVPLLYLNWFKITFEGIRGQDYKGDIAIDDISIGYRSNCIPTDPYPFSPSTIGYSPSSTMIPVPSTSIAPSPTPSSACGTQTMTGMTGQFASPNYPSNYPSNTDCSWTIHPNTVVTAIIIVFRSFYLEDHSSCVYDYVQVGGQKYCGNRGTFNVTVHSNTTNVQFHSDGSVQHNGFNATYSTITGSTMIPVPSTSIAPSPTPSSGNILCLENRMEISFERYEVNGLIASLRNTSCTNFTRANQTHLTAVVPLNACGTTGYVTKDHVVYHNRVCFRHPSWNIISNAQCGHSFAFTCSYKRRGNVTSGGIVITPRNITRYKAGFGLFSYSLNVYKESDYTQMYTDASYPLPFDSGVYMYFEASVSSGDKDLDILVMNCHAAPSTERGSWPSFGIIKDGCGMDSSFQRTYTPNYSFERFHVKAFQMQTAMLLYVHCDILICLKGPNTRCSKGCLTRKRREIDLPSDDKEQITLGPVFFTSKKADSKGPLINVKSKPNVLAILLPVFAGATILCIAVFFITRWWVLRHLSVEPVMQDPALEMATTNMGATEAFTTKAFLSNRSQSYQVPTTA